MAISFFFNNAQVTLTDRRRLKSFISGLFKSYRREVDSLSYIFCSDKYLLEINRKFLKRDYYTDIITFDLSENSNLVVGEIYISVERVKENSKALKVPVNLELHRVIFHGALHLCGFNDKSKPEKIKMTLEEDKNLKKYLGDVPRIPF